jgi:hypothetical protein
MEPTATAARRLWEAIEPVHAVVYFDPESTYALRRLGLRGFWMSYFAGRFSPLGPIGPDPVAAMAFGFAPWMVARALPDAWGFAAAEAVLAARLDSAARALHGGLPADATTAAAELADLLDDAVRGCRADGRPLAAGWLGVEAGPDPLGRLWLRTTVLREHRGDGHVAAAVSLGLSGLETGITHVAAGAVPRERLQGARGWTDAEWDAAVRGLRERNLLDAEGGLTAAGTALRRELEQVTDRLAAGPVERLGAAGVERAIELAAPLGRHLVDGGIVPVPNPIGAPRP